MKKLIGKIDAMPSLEGIAKDCLSMLLDPLTSESSREFAKEEIMRMAKVAQAYVELKRSEKK